MKLIKFWKILLVMASVLIILVGCSEADKVNTNISKQADYFECERRITVYNARTDLVILECEGYLVLSNNSNNELVVTVKTGPATYKKITSISTITPCMWWRILRVPTRIHITISYISTRSFSRMLRSNRERGGADQRERLAPAAGSPAAHGRDKPGAVAGRGPGAGQHRPG